MIIPNDAIPIVYIITTIINSANLSVIFSPNFIYANANVAAKEIL